MYLTQLIIKVLQLLKYLGHFLVVVKKKARTYFAPSKEAERKEPAAGGGLQSHRSLRR